MPEEYYDWERVVALDPKGHLEWQNPVGVMVYNGPVQSIKIDEADFVHIELDWVAQMPYPGKPGYGRWKVADGDVSDYKHMFPNLVVPFQIQETDSKGPRIVFGNMTLLYINPGNNLDPAKVEGLDLQRQFDLEK